MDMLTVWISGMVAMAIVLHMAGVGLRVSMMVAIGTMTVALVVALWKSRRGRGGKAD